MNEIYVIIVPILLMLLPLLEKCIGKKGKNSKIYWVYAVQTLRYFCFIVSST